MQIKLKEIPKEFKIDLVAVFVDEVQELLFVQDCTLVW